MPALRANPSVDQAAKVWTRGFAAAVRDAAGAGRLTPKKAANMSGPYADNAQNYFDHTGRKSAKADTVIDSGARYVRAKLEDVAGNNGRLSLVELRRLPADLKDDMLRLRGKKVESPSPGSVSLSALKDAVLAMGIDEITDYGKSFDVSAYPPSKSREDIMRDILDYDDLTDAEARDAFDSTKGAKASSDLAGEMRDIGKDQQENADDGATGDKLKRRFDDVAGAIEGFFGDGSQFKSIELLEHSIAEDGDTEHRAILAKKSDDSWLVLHYTDFPF